MMRNNQRQSDISFMMQALDLAKQGLGRVAPNPSVGCIIVNNNEIVGQGRTQDGGRPHAEVVALTQAGRTAQGATAYVTLEPCSHTGQTPPCAQALIDKGVKRVVIACTDPDPRVSGRGVRMLKHAQIEVTQGVCEQDALEVNKGFFLKIRENRPLITLKMAVSKDGKIAGYQGKPVQISSDASIKHMHQTLRATHDAIMVGINTAVKDNPSLTTRYREDLPPHDPIKFVLGNAESISSKPSILMGTAHVLSSHDLRAVMQILTAKHGVTRLLMEGGAKLMTAFLEEGLWDELHIYHSTMTIGCEGVEAPNFGQYNLALKEMQNIGPDRLAIYRPQQ